MTLCVDNTSVTFSFDRKIDSCYRSLHFISNVDLKFCWQIRTEEMDLIAERGIAAHYSGKVFVNGLVGHAMPSGRTSRGKAVCLNNANIALRVQ